METRELSNFFDHTDWNDPSAYPPGAGSGDTLGTFEWPYGPPPATIHSVSATIPDQNVLHGYPSYDHNNLISPHTTHFTNTADDLQAASTLFNNAQIGSPASRSHSYQGPMTTSGISNGQAGNSFNVAMVPTPNGLLSEQLAALLPNHHAEGSIEASIAAQWASQPAQQQHAAQFREIVPPRPALKRPYTYGTDSAFGESGFQVSSKQQTESFVVDRLMYDMHHGPPQPRSPTNGDAKIGVDDELDSDEDEEEDDDIDDRAAKRRKSKTAAGKSAKTNSGSRKAALAGRNRKASSDDRVSKKKRGSLATQKAQRENLTEEQKRNNHILSEQKRRNLIKRGFDDLHALVPELRNGGLSKSGILTEAANYLESLIADNKQYEELIASAAG